MLETHLSSSQDAVGQTPLPQELQSNKSDLLQGEPELEDQGPVCLSK